MQVQVHLNNQSNQSCQDLQMFFLLELHCTEYKTVLCLKRERRGNLNLSDLTQGWRLKSSIKPDSCLGRGGGGGRCRQGDNNISDYPSHNPVGTFSCSLSLQGGRCWGLWLWIDGGTNSQLHENTHAEMVARNKNSRVGQWA